MAETNPVIVTIASSPYASFLRRFAASVIDALVMLIPMAILHGVVPFIGGILIGIFYWPFMESSRMRATIGKRVMGIQVTTLAGETLQFRMALLRYAMKTGSSFLFCFGHFFALFTERKQALHDMVAETVVVPGVIEVDSIWEAWTESLRSGFKSF